MSMQIHTPAGLVAGSRENGAVVFKGIPFAKAKRFCYPEKPEKTEGMINLEQFPPMCPQPLSEPGTFYYKEFNHHKAVTADEDCLYLNIWMPEGAKSGDKLPVAFWIYGGAFTTGYSADDPFDGTGYVKRGVILVTINYRVGAFGFLCHPWLQEESGRCGNYGIADQLMALDWVQDNIAAFGGDPANVTVFGESAGAASIMVLSSSEKARGKFAKAIFESCAGYRYAFQPDLTLEQEIQVGERLVEHLGVSSLAELRAVSPEAIVAAQTKVREDGILGGFPPFMPYMDGDILDGKFFDILAEGRNHNIPYIIGSTANDLEVDPATAGDPTRSKIHYGCVEYALNEEAQGHQDTYVFYFARKLPGDNAEAFHACEMWYVFDDLDKCWRPFTEADYELADRVITYWTNFMKTGDPNLGSEKTVPEWKPCKAADPAFMTFDV